MAAICAEVTVRGVWVVLAMFIAASCDVGDEQVIPTRFTGTFSTVQCWTGPNAVNTAPCRTYISPSHSDWIDSGRVVFGADNVQWMLGTHTYWCPCYLGGCTDPCYDGAPAVDQRTGEYSIVADTVMLHFSSGTPQTLKLVGDIPDRVGRDWPGPDSLLCIGCPTSFGAVILKAP
jgi:hypothetical protein